MRRRRFVQFLGAATVSGAIAGRSGAVSASNQPLEFFSACSLLDSNGGPLTDDDTVAVWAEDTARNENADWAEDAVDYGDRSIPLMAVDEVGRGQVVGFGSVFVADREVDDDTPNRGVYLDVWDELVGGSTVLWDETLGQYWTLDRCRDLASAARDRGYDVRSTYDLRSDIDEADAVVITSPAYDLYDSTLDAIAEFVAGGGTLLLHDQSDYGGYDATEQFNRICSTVGAAFRFNDDQVVDPSNNAGSDYDPTTTVTNGSFPFFDGDGGGGGGNEAPSAAFSVSDATPTVGTDVTYDATGSTDPDGSIDTYEWDFGDGFTGTGRSVDHYFDAPGEYTVTLTVTDDDGATASASRTLTAETDGGGGGGNEAPSAAFSVSTATPTVGTNVTFDANESSDPDGSIATYEWDFGDGASGTGRSVDHTFDAAGEYTVTLTVTDDGGATASASRTLTAENGGGGGDGRTTATVRSVSDGDTISVEYEGTNESIRVLGVDTAEKPRNSDAERKQEWEGIESLDYLGTWGENGSSFAAERFSQGDTVEIAFDSEEGRRDPFDRLLAYVYYDANGDGTRDKLYNEELIREGYARVYGSSLSNHDQFWSAEQEARSAGRGIWANSDPGNSTAIRNGAVEELYVPDPAPVWSNGGRPENARTAVLAESTASATDGTYGDPVPLAAVDSSAGVGMVGGLIIDESYEQSEGFAVDTSGYGNFPFLTNLIDYVGSGSGDVLIDGGHGGFGSDAALSNEDAAYYQRFLEGVGIEFDQFNDLANPPASLSNYRTVILTPPTEDYTSAETSALQSFVDAGGSVVFLGSGAASDAARRRMNDLAATLGTDLRLGSGRVRDGSNNLNGNRNLPTTAQLNGSLPLFSSYGGSAGTGSSDGTDGSDGDGSTGNEGSDDGDGSDNGDGTDGSDGGSNTEQVTGSLSDGGNAAFEYATVTDTPSEVEITLSGPASADFDLYVTTDGRVPSTDDFDRRSWSYGSTEGIVVGSDVVGPDTTLGILVDSYEGPGSYVLTVQEQD